MWSLADDDVQLEVHGECFSSMFIGQLLILQFNYMQEFKY